MTPHPYVIDRSKSPGYGAALKYLDAKRTVRITRYKSWADLLLGTLTGLIIGCVVGYLTVGGF